MRRGTKELSGTPTPEFAVIVTPTIQSMVSVYSKMK